MLLCAVLRPPNLTATVETCFGGRTEDLTVEGLQEALTRDEDGVVKGGGGCSVTNALKPSFIRGGQTWVPPHNTFPTFFDKFKDYSKRKEAAGT